MRSGSQGNSEQRGNQGARQGGSFVHSASREAQLLLARPWDLAMISWLPLLACALLWWIFSAGLPTRLPIGILDEDHTALSRQLVRFLQATPGLSVAERFENGMEAQQSLQGGRVDAVVMIPQDFTRTVKQGRAAQVTLLHNAQLGTHSGLIQRDVRTVVATLSAGVEMNARNRRGEAAQQVRVSIEPVRTAMVTLFNTSLDYEQFLTAALIPALLHVLSMTAGAWCVGRELRDGTVSAWLRPAHGATPRLVRIEAALLGKLSWSFLGLGLSGTIALMWLTTGRGWHPSGSLAWTALALWAMLGLSLAMGAAVSALTLSLRTALSATGFITAPAFAFSGVGFPLLAMPAGARAWADVLPFTHYVRLQTEQLQMGAPWSVCAVTPLVMMALAVVLLLACAPLLRRALERPQSWGKR